MLKGSVLAEVEYSSTSILGELNGAFSSFKLRIEELS